MSGDGEAESAGPGRGVRTRDLNLQFFCHVVDRVSLPARYGYNRETIASRVWLRTGLSPARHQAMCRRRPFGRSRIEVFTMLLGDESLY